VLSRDRPGILVLSRDRPGIATAMFVAVSVVLDTVGLRVLTGRNEIWKVFIVEKRKFKENFSIS
jgi:hypothetical protein